jgi:hypothetical protein
MTKFYLLSKDEYFILFNIWFSFNLSDEDNKIFGNFI